ncbi:N-acetylmuramoyl-L-alanine amidase [Bacillus litorisediminis]|uniref:N-acetylmuramoyl-L-alanine amidase n=1 Tax=Bacillus litorisediminis TaxID=2922713 RepID=UPI0024351DED|nr:N-acetylmuramoyl-L-alanine amidase [Bacillus litorisediminis]
MNIIQDFIPGYKAYSMAPKYITVHTTRNLSKGANARMHSKYLKGTDTSQKSWHLTVDDKEVIQHIPFDVNGWHAGDGQGKGNRQSIGIEICENEDGDFDKAVHNAIELIQYLINKFNIPIENVVPHKRWSGKSCPVRLLPVWDKFIDEVKGVKKNDIEGHWAEKSLQKAINKDILKGYEDGTYKPDEPLTMARFMVFLDRLNLLD